MDTEITSIIDAINDDDYQSMKKLFTKKEINEEVYSLLLLESYDDQKLQTIFLVEAMNIVKDMINRLTTVNVKEIDLSALYPDIIEGKEYPYSVFDNLNSQRNKHLAKLVEDLKLQKTYTPTANELIAMRYLELHHTDEVKFDSEVPIKNVEIVYCREPFKFVEVAQRGYGANKYCKFTFNSNQVLEHKYRINIEYPSTYAISEQETRDGMLNLLCNKTNQTDIMVDEMKKKFEIERLYNNMTELYTKLEGLKTSIDEKESHLSELNSKISSAETNLDTLTQQVSDLGATVAELEMKKENLQEIADKKADIAKVEALTQELEEKHSNYNHLMKALDRVEYYEKNNQEIKIWKRCYVNVKEITQKLKLGEESLNQRREEFEREMNDRRRVFETEMELAKKNFEEEIASRTEIITKRENEYEQLKKNTDTENQVWKQKLEDEYRKQIDAYPLLTERVEALIAENEKLAADKKELERKTTKLENALDVLKSSWR